MKSHDGKEVIGWENIELISDRPLEVMLKEFKQLKAEFPDRILIASIMEECNKAAVSGWGGAAAVQGAASKQAATHQTRGLAQPCGLLLLGAVSWKQAQEGAL
jgi:hypothetical protein